MCADWINGFSPQIVLDEVAKISSVNESGSIVFALMALPEHFDSILESSVKFDADIPRCEYRNLIRLATSESVKSNRLNTGYFRSALRKAENAYRARPMQKFILASSVSFAFPSPFRKRRMANCEFRLRRTLPSRFDRTEIKEQTSAIFPMPLPHNYTTVLTHVEARSAKEAGHNALENLGVLLGIWNYILTRGRVSLFFGSSRRAIGALALGPIHTLHFPDGVLFKDSFWYEPGYIRPPSILRMTQREKTSFLKTEKYVRTQLEKTREREMLRQAFRTYGEALNDTSLDTAFLKLWAVLEQITGTTQDAADKTIKRIEFLFSKTDMMRQELRHIRERRNRLVHLNETNEDRETQLQQLKKYIDYMLGFHLHKMNISKTIDEIGEFLDQPTDASEIAKRICESSNKTILLKAVQNFRGK